MRGRWLVIALLLLPARAWAVPFIWDQEICQVDASTVTDGMDTQPFQVSIASPPTNSNTTFGDDTNECSLYYNVSSGIQKYLGRTAGLSSETTVCAMAWINATSTPTSPREILSFANGTTKTAFLTVEDSGSGYRVKNWYEDTGDECVTSTNNGTECTTNSDCAEANPGEAQCGGGNYGSGDEFDYGSWYVVALEQSNIGGGVVQEKLFLGEPGAVYQRSSRSKKQGSCTGGTEDGFACGENADCDSNVCDTSDVLAVTRVNFGTNDTVAEAFEYYLDNLYVSDTGCTQALANYRMIKLIPESTVASQWTISAGSAHEVLDDVSTTGVAPDGDTTYASENRNNDAYTVSMTDADSSGDTCSGGTCVDSLIACDDSSDCMQAAATVPVVSQVSALKDHNNTAGNDARTTTFQPEFASGPNTSADTGTYVLQQTNASYQLGGYFATETQSGTTAAWTLSAINSTALRGRYLKGDCKTSCDVRNTASVMSAMVLLPTPPTPAVLPDNDGDGADTVGYIGDSRMNGVVESASSPLLAIVEPTNIYDCAWGGMTVGDFLTGVDVVAQGSPNGWLRCLEERGSSDQQLDVAVVMFGINSHKGQSYVRPDITINCDANADCAHGTCRSNTCGGSNLCTGTLYACVNNTDCGYCDIGQVGYCDDDGGADEGNECYCPRNDYWISDSAAGANRWCISGGADFATECLLTTDCACSSGADCNAGSTCSAGTCTVSAGAGGTCAVNASKPASYCVPGCVNVPGCTSGVCVSGNSLADSEDAFRKAVDDLLAVSGGMDVVLVLEPPAEMDYNPITDSVSSGCWHWYNPIISAFNAFVRQLASENNNLHLVDAWAYLHKCCPSGDPTNCLADGIHFDDDGNTCMADIIVQCLTNASGASDGICDEGTSLCTQGRVGFPCTENHDCDYYDCAFTP